MATYLNTMDDKSLKADKPIAAFLKQLGCFHLSQLYGKPKCDLPFMLESLKIPPMHNTNLKLVSENCLFS